jgi:menaquinone-dependent protoporphyrinogen oxidase
MSRILVLFGTTDGQTAKIAGAIGATLRHHGMAVDVIEASTARVNPEDYVGVVVAASVHAGGYQRAVRRWVRTYAATLDGRPTAFVSVCLGVLQPDPEVQRQVAETANHFVVEAGWHPTVVKHVAGALPYTRYNLFKRWIMKRIVATAGGDTDTTRDYEYTDWVDLRSFAQQFARTVSEARAA